MTDSCISINPLLENYYRLRIEGPASIPDLRLLDLFCQEANVPGVSIEMGEQPTPMSVGIPLPGNKLSFEPLVVKFVVDEEVRNWDAIRMWLYGMAPPESSCGGDDAPVIPYREWHGNASLEITDHTYGRNVNRLVRYVNLAPVRLSQLMFISTPSETKQMVAYATFRYSYYKFAR